MPQLDPCCFPLLHPRGTLGFRWFMKKNGTRPELTDEEKRMQEELDEANQLEGEEILDETADQNPLPMAMDDENNMDEEENELDQDDLQPMAMEQSVISDGDEDIVGDGEPMTKDPQPMAMEKSAIVDDEYIVKDGEQQHDENVPQPMAVEQPATDDSDADSLNDGEQQLDSDEIDLVAKNDNILDPDAQSKSSTGGSKSNISERQFYRYRLAMRANKKGTFHWLW